MCARKIYNQNSSHFITFTIVGWIDLFSRPIFQSILIDSIKYCQANKGLVVNAYAIMTNHIHMICRAELPHSLSDIVRDLKRHTSKEFMKEIDSNRKESRREWLLELFRNYGNSNSRNEEFQIWQQYNFPTELASPQFTLQKLNYIHFNPVRANFVDKPEDYMLSSARQYLGKPGVIDIEELDLGSSVGFIFG